MTTSKNPKYWDNDKSRALRSLTMRLTRLHRTSVGTDGETMTPQQWDKKQDAIKQARDEIYAINRVDFTIEDRERIFKRWKLDVNSQNEEKRDDSVS